MARQHPRYQLPRSDHRMWGQEVERQGQPGNLGHRHSKCVHLWEATLDAGGFDNGGAWWGHGSPLYVAKCEHGYIEYTRASTRYMAMLNLRLRPEHLRVAPKPPVNRRLTTNTTPKGTPT